MLEWKCGNCGKVYNFDDFISLKTIKLVESDTDPRKQHGYTPVCECGYRFHIDRWRKDDSIKIKYNEEDLDLLVSSIFLEMNHKTFDEKDEYYETAILWFNKDNTIKNIEIIKRYGTKEDAIENHSRIVNLIKDGNIKLIKLTVFGKEENSIVLD